MKALAYYVTVSRGYDARLAVPIISTAHARVIDATLRALRDISTEGLVSLGLEEPPRRRCTAPTERQRTPSRGHPDRTARTRGRAASARPPPVEQQTAEPPSPTNSAAPLCSYPRQSPQRQSRRC
jgi:hypothetical protein